MSELRRSASPDGRPRTVLVLGGGGVKGLAHIGAWRALEERGIRPDAIIGTSIGALVGALIAAGASADALAEHARALGEDDIVRLNRWVAWVRGFRQTSVYLGDRYKDYIRQLVPVERWEQLAIPLRINAVSLSTGRELWFGTGARTELPLPDAIYASGALPLYFPPLPYGDDDALVDGMLGHALPIEAGSRWAHGGRVIAVDVGADFKRAPADAWLKHGLIGVHQRTIEILADRIRREAPARRPPGLVRVRPPIGHLGTFDFGHADETMRAGYEATAEALDSLEAAERAAAGGRRGAVRDWLRRAARALPGTRG